MLKSESGAVLIEQAYAIVLIAIISVGATYALGTTLDMQFNSTVKALHFKQMSDSDNLSPQVFSNGGEEPITGNELENGTR